MRNLFILASVLIFFCMTSPLANAGMTTEPKLIGTYGDWSAYSFKEEGDNICYILSSPKKAAGAYKKRGEIFATVTHRPAEKSLNVFSVIAGYSYKPQTSVTLNIDKQKFVLFTQKDSAWAPDPTTDKAIVDAMRKGKVMTVTGTSSKETKTVDTYGLKGTADAFAAIAKACGITAP